MNSRFCAIRLCQLALPIFEHSCNQHVGYAWYRIGAVAPEVVTPEPPYDTEQLALPEVVAIQDEALIPGAVLPFQEWR